MEYVKLDDILRTEDGISFLKEHSPVFMSQFKKFLHDASYYVDALNFNTGEPNYQTDVVNFEYSYYGARKVVLSFNSGIKNRDLDCQFKQFEKVEFALDGDGNLVIYDQTGRLESKYGYDFKTTDGGVLKTDYSYQVIDPEGKELLYRGYRDQFTVEDKDFKRLESNMRGPIRGAYDPGLNKFDGKELLPTTFVKHPRLVERHREVDNTVKVTDYSFDNHEVSGKDERCVGQVEFKEEGRTMR